MLFVWTFPYVRELRDQSPAGFILRPVVPLRFVGPDGSRSDPFEALIDSGAENILTPEWVASSLGLELHGEPTSIRIGGNVRSTRFCDVDIVIEGPDGKYRAMAHPSRLHGVGGPAMDGHPRAERIL